MKNLFSYITAFSCCIIYPVSLRAQDDTFRNLSLTNPEKNIVYMGLPNQVMIAGMKMPAADGYEGKYEIRDIQGEKCTLIPVSTGNFSFTYTDVNSQDQTVYFEARRIPLPDVHVAGMSADKCTVQEILDNPKLVIVCDIPDTYLDYEIISYRFGCKVNNSYIEYQSAGSEMSADILRVIKQLQPGDKIYFDDVRLKMPGGEIRITASMKMIR